MTIEKFVELAKHQTAANELVLTALRMSVDTLKVHNGLAVYCEGERFELDFEPELRVVEIAIELIINGVVPFPPLHGVEATIDLPMEKQPSNDGRVLRALYVVFYALSVHEGMVAVSGERRWVLDFRPQKDMLGRAMALMGVDTSTPLLAPVPRQDAGDDD